MGNQRSRVSHTIYSRTEELRFSITLSPVYPAAASLLGGERGLSMRFPRFMKLRSDKSWEQATTSDQFADMYRKQIREAPARPPGPGQIKRVSEERDVELDGEEEEAEDILSDAPEDE
jgi:DNA ligase-1